MIPIDGLHAAGPVLTPHYLYGLHGGHHRITGELRSDKTNIGDSNLAAVVIDQCRQCTVEIESAIGWYTAVWTRGCEYLELIVGEAAEGSYGVKLGPDDNAPGAADADVEHYLHVDARCRANTVDGLKVSGPQSHLTLTGEYAENGGGEKGDGIDLYPGGIDVMLSRVVSTGNATQGIDIKQGGLGGPVRIAIRDSVCNNNGRSGVSYEPVKSYDRPDRLTIHGLEASHNGEAGLHMCGERITADAVFADANQRGVRLAGCRYVSLANVHATENTIAGMSFQAWENSPDTTWYNEHITTYGLHLFGNASEIVVDPGHPRLML